MNIAFFGSSLVSAYWNGAATYYRGIIKELHRLGHEITFYEPDAYGRQEHRDIDPPDWCRVHVYSSEGVDGVSAALEEAVDADLLVKASGVGVFDNFLEKAIPNLKRSGALAVFWDVDAPATLDRMHSDPADPFRPLIPKYDFVLTYGGGDPVVAAYKQLGAHECVPVYNAADPETHHPIAPDPRFHAKLGFLGNRLPDREQRVEEFFLAAALRCPHRTFLLGGNGWGEKPLPQNVRYAGHVYTADHNAFNCTPEAVLNISRASMARYGFSPATRVFEAAAAAACLISDAWNGLELFLEPEREVLVARDGEEVAEFLKSLRPERRRAIGLAAKNRVLSQHTYAHRARKVDRLLSSSHYVMEAVL
jgi:spore maturation protein CgeB